MRPSTFWYTLKQGFKNIKRNWMFSLASVLTMAACIFLFGIFYSIVNNVNAIAKKVETEVPITVLFVEGTTEEQIMAVKAQVEAREEVDHVDYISADQAWEEWSQQYFGDSEAAEGFKDDNPLVNSSSLHIYVNQIEKQASLVAYIQTLENIREVNQLETATKTLGSFNELISYVSIGIIVVLLLISIFLISNTVSVGISVRKEEIGIMKLIGATDRFVRAPFLLEGILLGIIGAAIPLVGLYFAYNTAIGYILEKFNVLTSFMAFIPVEEIYLVLVPVGLLLGMGIGLVGSFITTRKHLRV